MRASSWVPRRACWSGAYFITAAAILAACGNGSGGTHGDGGDVRGDAIADGVSGDGRADGGDVATDVTSDTPMDGTMMGDGTDGPAMDASDGGVDGGGDAADAPTDGMGCTGSGTVSCGVGACRRTVQVCVDGHMNMCVPGSPSPEVCDGIDNDCDGVVDNGLGQTTCGMGACQRTVDNCSMGMPQSCVAGRPAPETCNGIDDDCDGMVDNGLGQTTCGVGACQRTVDNCSMGTPQTCSPGTPTMEVCNGIDDDCDGTIDNGLGMTTCGMGACRRTVLNCLGGTMQMCVPGTPTAEVCNGMDDDCNGVVDDGLGTVTCGVGACQRTIPACVSGTMQTCLPGMPAPETCDGIDNDCDGTIDNGDPGGGMVCSSGYPGVCSTGITHCQGGRVTCVPNVMPGSMMETCNGLDDNCNGLVDDAAISQLCPPPSGGNVMTEVCNGGMGCSISACAPGYFDVDGTVTNGCECHDDTNPQVCGSANSLGEVAIGGMATASGKVVPAPPAMAADWGDWFVVTFTPTNSPHTFGGGTPSIQFTVNDGGVFRFELRSGCTASSLGCGTGSPAATGLTQWSFTDTGDAAGAGTYSTRNVSWPSTVYIRVFRNSPGPSCANYALSITR